MVTIIDIKSAGNTARTSLIPTPKAEQNQVSTTIRIACQALRLWRLLSVKREVGVGVGVGAWVGIYLSVKVQTLTTKDCKGRQTNLPKNVGSIKNSVLGLGLGLTLTLTPTLKQHSFKKYTPRP